MPTENRRVATYLPKEIDDRLKAFIVERNLKGDSPALIAILSEFFGVSQEATHQSSSLITSLQDRVEALEQKFVHIKSELYSELRIELLEHRSSSIEQTKAEVKDELLSEFRSKLPANTEVPGQLPIPDVQISQEKLDEISKLSSESEGNIPSSSISESSNRSVEPLSGTELAQRFGVHEKLPTNKRGLLKSAQKFAEWTKEQDPDGIAWRYDPNAKGKKRYFPINVPDSKTENSTPLDRVNPLPEGSERSEEG